MINNSNSNYIPIYIGMRSHQDIGIIGIYYYFQNQNNYRIIKIVRSKRPLYISDALLTVLLYVYMNCDLQHYNVKIYTNRKSILNIIKHLGDWEAQDWKPSNITSSQMYKYAKLHNTSVEYNKIPSNYRDHIDVFKRIERGLMAFHGHLKLGLISSKDKFYKHLMDILLQHLKGMKYANHPSRQPHNSHKTGYRLIEVPVTPEAKAKFTEACRNNGTDPKSLIQKSIKEYIISNGGHISDIKP